MDFILLTDGYKLDHRRQYPEGTEFVYSNFTARSTRIGGADSVVFFGLQYFLQRYLMEHARETFFGRPRYDVVDNYQRFLDSYLGPNAVGVEHIRELHALGFMPLQFWALPEGTNVPFRMPMFTLQNTRQEFFWVTNYIETLMSALLWMPCTSASTAQRYRRLLATYAALTGGNPAFVPWQGHDFSFRGMASPEAAALSGAGHLLSFKGTDSIPSIELLRRYYGDDPDGIGGSVPATEHSVMCAGGQEGEQQTFERLLDLYPAGVLSVVSDTWNLWFVLAHILPALKHRILARDGKLVIRPDSGDPVLILTGDAGERPGTAPHKGVIETLWDIFGGRVNSAGLKVLDSHIGAIYGDSITEARAREICDRLMAKGFASTNVVLGIGSYTYQYVTRDTNGFAVKATWAQINGQEHLLQKDPFTDQSGKKSARGRIVIRQGEGGLQMIDGLTSSQQMEHDKENLLRLVWKDGHFVRRELLTDIRARVIAHG